MKLNIEQIEHDLIGLKITPNVIITSTEHESINLCMIRLKIYAINILTQKITYDYCYLNQNKNITKNDEYLLEIVFDDDKLSLGTYFRPVKSININRWGEKHIFYNIITGEKIHV